MFSITMELAAKKKDCDTSRLSIKTKYYHDEKTVIFFPEAEEVDYEKLRTENLALASAKTSV